MCSRCTLTTICNSVVTPISRVAFRGSFFVYTPYFLSLSVKKQDLFAYIRKNCTFARKLRAERKMKDEIVPYQSNEEGVVIYQTDDNTLQLDVQIADETVWLTQQQMAELFQKDRTVITRHINNIFSEGELEEKSNVHFWHFPLSDKPTKVYNLDVIISVGYRVKSQRGTQFRRWATKIIRDYTLKGYAVNQRILAVEERVDNRLIAHERRLEAVEEMCNSAILQIFTNSHKSHFHTHIYV